MPKTTKKKKEMNWEEIGQAVGRKVEQESKKPGWKKAWMFHKHEHGGFFYFMGFLGALVYYVTTATSLWGAFIGFLKAIIWPTFLVFELLTYVGA